MTYSDGRTASLLHVEHGRHALSLGHECRARLGFADVFVGQLKHTPDEADYMNYMFNDAKFSNPLALRNRYDHADGSVDWPLIDEEQLDAARKSLSTGEDALPANLD